MPTERIRAWDMPVLESVVPVVDLTDNVRTNLERVEWVADWMAYEPFAPPGSGPSGSFSWGDTVADQIDAVMLRSVLDFAFTDFASGRRFEVDYEGGTWSDSEAMHACLHRAWRAGTPVLEGGYLATVAADDLDRIFQGTVTMPMLDERASVLNAVGAILEERYGGRFHRFIPSCAPAVYADGDGLLERLIVEFPRFDDRSAYKERTILFHKLAQLALWSLHLTIGPERGLDIRGLDRLTAFADYIVPVALRVMGILEYSEDLDRRIGTGEIIERDSNDEIEIRLHTIYGTALLTDAINRRRPADRAVIIPHVDFRLWSVYHTTHWPHHLTRTTMY
ncbi:MAG: queuosine salvage family protein [Acidimicrobiia bacterium]